MNLQVLLGNTEIDVSSSITLNSEENSFEITTTVDVTLMILKIVGVPNPSTAGSTASLEVVMKNSDGNVLDIVDYGLVSNIVCDSGSTIRLCLITELDIEVICMAFLRGNLLRTNSMYPHPSLQL